MSAADTEDFTAYSQGLGSIRRRRWFLWLTIIMYIPSIWVSLQLTHSDRTTFMVFVIWFAVTAYASGYAAIARCPRCKNYFHLKGVLSLYLRRCMHCDLHLNSDRKVI
jgi:hypothetical protein